MMGPLKRFFREIRKPRPASPASLARSHDIMARKALAEANSARDRREWATAAEAYAAYLRLRPDAPAIHVQLGNMLLEAGEFTGSEAAYRSALGLEQSVDAWLQLGRALGGQGRTDAAVSALAEALKLAPDRTDIHDDLIALGARDRVPRGRYEDLPGHDLATGRARLTDLQLWRAEGIYPVAAYGDFRRDMVATSPPMRPEAKIAVLVDALFASPARVRATLQGLAAQEGDWTAFVIGPQELRDHSVASVAHIDPRIRFMDLPDLARVDLRRSTAVSLTAGTVLEPGALDWLVFALRRAGAQLVYADHDHAIDDWKDGPAFIDPVFYPQPDLEDMRTTRLPPEVVMFNWRAFGALWTETVSGCQVDPDLLADAGARTRRALVMAATTARVVAHLPRIIANVKDLPTTADRGARAPDEQRPGWLSSAPAAPEARTVAPEVDDRSIAVIIPTRDQPELLEACVRSLFAMAARPERLRVLIVDNRSVDPRTQALIETLAREFAVERLVHDEPFNWSRANNVAAAACDEDVLLFLNNDTEMLSRGWDTVLCGHLASQNAVEDGGVGLVGARLLYPDQTLQHGGIVLGVGDGEPRHEGVGAAAVEWGPLGRWRRTRAAAAVTGAFMAVPRAVFEQVGGFDEAGLMIGYNDIDYCLKVRASGLSVVYAADIELIHHESKSRGINDTQGRAAWDQGELKSLYARWGDRLFWDPGLNPHWHRGGVFAALRQPTFAETLFWLEVSASEDPWLPQRSPKAAN